MNKTQNTETAATLSLIDQLRKALMHKDRKQILDLYSKAETIDFELVQHLVFDTYDDLISECNDFLYQD